MSESRAPLTDAEVEEVIGYLSTLFHRGYIGVDTYYLSAFLVADAVVKGKE